MSGLFQTEQEEAAEEFIEKMRRIFAGKSDIIYSFEGEVRKRNVISPSTIGHRDAWVYVELYNVCDPEEIFDRHMWMKLGNMDADVDTWEHNGEQAVMEIFKRFK